MAHLITSNVTLSPDKSGKWQLNKSYSFELESDEPSSFKINIQKNIDLLTADIKRIEDPEEQEAIKQKIIKDIDTQHLNYQDALMHFRKYMSDTVKQFHKDSDKKRTEMLEFCQNVNQIKLEMLEASNKKITEKTDSLKRQLAREKEDIKAYAKI